MTISHFSQNYHLTRTILLPVQEPKIVQKIGATLLKNQSALRVNVIACIRNMKLNYVISHDCVGTLIFPPHSLFMSLRVSNFSDNLKYVLLY